jgi:hypothetical protein
MPFRAVSQTRRRLTIWPFMPLMGLCLLSGCYLTSTVPVGTPLSVSERDVVLGKQINDVLSEASEYLKDVSRLVGAAATAAPMVRRDTSALTEAPEYTTLFNPTEPVPLSWTGLRKNDETGFFADGKPRRFSRPIWNEAVYLMQRKNPNFGIRVEGRSSGNESQTGPYLFEALVFMVDTAFEKSAEMSHPFLTARPVCKENRCNLVVRLSYKTIASALGTAMSYPEWSGTTGNLTANVTETTTDASIEDLAIKGKLLTIRIAKLKYHRTRSTNVSEVEAEGTVTPLDQKEIPFTLKGNLRDIASLVRTTSTSQTTTPVPNPAPATQPAAPATGVTRP